MNKNEKILQKLKEKSIVKQEAYEETYEVFKIFRKMAKIIAEQAKEEIQKINKNISIEFIERNDFEFELIIAGDLLLVSMHSNVFEFPDNHFIHNTSYIKENPYRSYSGNICFYNFLSDSFKFTRTRDIGYLIGRMYINHEKHFFVEGKKQMGFLYNDFVNNVIQEEIIKDILESVILYCIDFDLYIPPFDAVKEVSVAEMLQIQSTISVKTGKRLGFKMQSEDDPYI